MNGEEAVNRAGIQGEGDAEGALALFSPPSRCHGHHYREDHGPVNVIATARNGKAAD